MSHNQPKHIMADYSGVLDPTNPQPNTSTVNIDNENVETCEQTDENKSAKSIKDNIFFQNDRIHDIDILKNTIHTLNKKIKNLEAEKLVDEKPGFEKFYDIMRSGQDEIKILMEKNKTLEDNQKNYELIMKDISYENNKLREELDNIEKTNTDRNISSVKTNTHPNTNYVNNLEKIVELLTYNMQNNNISQNNNSINNPGSSLGQENSTNFDKLIKKFKRFETIKNPREMLNYFKEEFHRLDIQSDNTKYNILIERWPTTDVSNFYKLICREKRNYKTFCEYCEYRDDHLTEVLGKIPEYDNTTPFSVYLADVTNWAESNKNDLIKFFAFYLAPKAIKSKIKECFDDSHEIFVKQIRRAWNNRQDEPLNPNSINFDKTQKYFFKQPKRFTRSDNNKHFFFKNNNSNPRHYSQQTNQHNNYNNKNFSNAVRNNQHRNFNSYNNNVDQIQSGNPNYNNQNINRNNPQVDLCFNHRRFGRKAWECIKPNSCPMAKITTSRQQQGNSSPSPSQ